MTMTPADFLAQPSDPDEDLEELSAAIDQAPNTLSRPLLPPDPLESIAESLRTLAQAAIVKLDGEDAAVQAHEDWSALKQEHDEIEALHDAKQQLIEQVLEVVKPSTSKLADRVRAVLDPIVEPPKPTEPTIVSEHGPELVDPPGPSVVATNDAPPAADADVEEWRGYARRRGFTGPDVDRANRSQIRTMLGIPHEGGE